MLHHVAHNILLRAILLLGYRSVECNFALSLVDIIIDETKGEVTFDGPVSKEQDGAQKDVMGDVMKHLSRFFEVKAALSQDPSNRELRQELKQKGTPTEGPGMRRSGRY